MNPPRSEILALRPTPLGAVDPRAKFLLCLLFTLAVVSVPFDKPLLLLPLAVPLALAVGAGDVPLLYLIRRLLLGLPFVILVVLFPLFLQRDPAVFRLGEMEFPVTTGAIRSFVVAGKFVLAFGAVVVLTATTGFQRICDAMARLRFPEMFVATVALVWRYLFVTLEEVERMRRARASRSVSRGSVALVWRSSASIVGGLFLRALGRSERIHGAMLARGFTGSMPAPRPSNMKWTDWTILSAGCAYISGCLFLLWGGFID